ncbi:hypothetical protein ABID23_000360 [Bartonella silvatica]|uniref:Transmembrane protein n=1 Tax=Bartonella silvatica TaxID=357760 RepID=A0ABV2HFG3_9HYPH
MVDFVGILKKAINAQSNITPQMRKQIYKRATETLERQFITATVSQEMVNEQRKSLQNAIATVEEEYRESEKQLLSSVIGWKISGFFEDDQCTRGSILRQDRAVSETETEEKREVANRPKDNRTFHNPHRSRVPDAEPINMEVDLNSQYVDDDTLKSSPLMDSVQGDNSHIVSHIFSQAVRRANRSSMKKRIVIGASVFSSFVVLTFAVFFVSEYIFMSNDYSLSGEKFQALHGVSKGLSVHKKLTQRLLEDGSEIDVGPDQATLSSNEQGDSKVVSGHFQLIEQLGEAVFYQERTNYDAEKMATGNAHWKLIKEPSHVKGAPEELAIQGDITIPDEGLSLRLILRRNTDASFPAAYMMDLIFILSDKFSGQAISSVQALTFKASEYSIGQSLSRTVAAKISDNFFLIALSGNHPFFDQNLQLIRELNWVRLILKDKNGRINELTFTKGPLGESLFHKVIGQWLAQSDKKTTPSETK